MKKIFTVLSLFVLTVVALSSCTREYYCECTYTYTGQPGLPDPQTSKTVIRNTKQKADDICTSRSKNYESGGVKTQEKCVLL